MKKMYKVKKAGALFAAFVLSAAILFAVPLQVFADTAASGDRLDAPDNFRFENVVAGVAIPDYQNAGIGPQVENGSRAIVWDSVPGAVGYRVYAFTSADETDPANAYRVQEVKDPQIVIGHGSVTQARRMFNETPGEQLCADTEPVNEEGYISWGVMLASARQDFDLPLPFKEFYFRVVAVAGEGGNDSEMSDYTLAKPGARSSSPSQSARLIEDAKARGAQYPYFVFIQTGTLRFLPDEEGIAAGGVAGRLYIPFSNTPSPNPDYFGDNIDGPTNRVFVERAAIEIQNHPAYIGEETLIFSG